MRITIIKPGMLTTIQDMGRKGYQKFGIIESGAMDQYSLQVANILVGNSRQEAALEVTLLGPTLHFNAKRLISICGGDFTPTINGEEVPQWRPVLVEAGTTLKMGAAEEGIRAYISISGGIDVHKVMGSRSTYLRAGIGGYQGRALQAGDVLQVRDTESSRNLISTFYPKKDKSFMSIPKLVSERVRPNYSSNPYIRVIKGKEFDLFTKESKVALLSDSFKVLPNSDRMGYRLEGPSLNLSETKEMISEAVTFGTIQVPTNKQPIVLMADRQTTGGYPRIGQVVGVDLPILAQLNFGSKIRFKAMTLYEAQKLYIKREEGLRLLHYLVRTELFNK